MAPGRFLASLLAIVIFSAGGFSLMQWLESAPAPVTIVTSAISPVVISRQSGCIGFNQSIDAEIDWQNRVGHPPNSARLASLRRDCVMDVPEHYQAVQR